MCNCLLRTCTSCWCSCRGSAPKYPESTVPEVEPLKTEQINQDQLLYYQVIEGIKAAVNAGAGDVGATKSSSKNYYIQSPNTALGGAVAMKDYDPGAFKAIRRAVGLTTKEYIKSWSFEPSEIPVPKVGAGRSGALFMFSKDKRLLFKTIPKHEAETLKAIIFNYKKYLESNPDSRLMRFFALHRFRAKNKYFYVGVANNCLYNPREISIVEKFDLKGRKIKDSSVKKKNYLEHANDGIWKDNQLHRTFAPISADKLRETITKDARFLASQLCIDYSLLIGVHKSEKPIHPKTLIAMTSREMTEEETNPNSPVKLADSKRYSFMMKDLHPEVGAGMPSCDRKEVYFVGIIDFLSRYFMKKKIANFAKQWRWKEAKLSTVPPSYYLSRFERYVPTIILDGEEVESESEEPSEEQKDEKEKVNFHIASGLEKELEQAAVITPAELGFKEGEGEATKEGEASEPAKEGVKEATTNGGSSHHKVEGGDDGSHHQVIEVEVEGDDARNRAVSDPNEIILNV